MGVGVLTVDDQEFFRSAAREVIEATPGFWSTGEASSGKEALALLEESPDSHWRWSTCACPGWTESSAPSG